MPDLIEDTILRLHTHGGRMTPQRRMILEALQCLGSHPTAEEIFSVVNQRDPSVNLSTVYRTLRWLEREGLVSARHFSEEHRQDRFDPALPVEHHHFLCTACKTVVEFNHPLISIIKSEFAARTGHRVDSASVTLYGLCPRCQQ